MNPNLQRALKYIESHNLRALTIGRHEIDGDNVFVVIEDAKMRKPADARLEAHNRYIDIQIPLSGQEEYGLRNRSECTQPVGQYDEKKDIIFFDDSFSHIESCLPGEMIIFYPKDAHAPLLGSGRVRKAIFKVLATEEQQFK